MTGIRLWQVAGWTMLHYVWIGAALGAVALVARHALRSAPASVRYLAALGSLLLLSAAPVAIAVVVAQSTAPVAHNAPPPLHFAAHPVTRYLDEMGQTTAADTPVPAESAQRQDHVRLVGALNLAAVCLPWLWICGAPLSLTLTTAELLGADRLRRQSRPLEDARIAGNWRSR